MFEPFGLILFDLDGGGGGVSGGSAGAPPTSTPVSTPAPSQGSSPSPVTAPGDQSTGTQVAPDVGDVAGSPPAPPEGWPEGVPFDDIATPTGISDILDQQELSQEPGTRTADQLQGQLDYYKSSLDEALARLQSLQGELQQYELAGLDEDEIARHQLDQERQKLEQERNALVEATWRRDLYQFYTQYVPESVITGAGNDPAQWQAAAFNHMRSGIADLYKQNKALRAALKVKLSSGAPNVPAAAGGPAPTGRSIRNLPREEREKLYRLADTGNIDWSTIS